MIPESNCYPNWVTHIFRIDPDNSVYLVIPKEDSIDSPVGYKAKFAKLWAGAQDGSIPLKRCPVTKLIQGQLTRFLATNYGVEYVAKMKTDTTTFSEAPEVIRELRDDLASLVADITSEKPEFNEGLAIGNYPDMKMNWHSDGEKGLGPVVASFSYGGDALMKFAMHNKYLFGHGGPGTPTNTKRSFRAAIRRTRSVLFRGSKTQIDTPRRSVARGSGKWSTALRKPSRPNRFWRCRFRVLVRS